MSDGQQLAPGLLLEPMGEREMTCLLCLHAHFSKAQGVTWLPQQRMGCGYGNDFERTIDVFGIATTKPWTRFCVEIKRTRADFLADIRQPLKQRRARLICNQFYYLAPKGVLAPDDVPLWAGLAEAYGKTDRFDPHITIVTEAPWFDTSPPTWRFVAQLARRAARLEASR